MVLVVLLMLALVAPMDWTINCGCYRHEVLFHLYSLGLEL
jgi:hypothetical protein